VNPSPVQSLACVDVSHSDNDPAIHQKALHWSPPADRRSGKKRSVNRGLERLSPKVREMSITIQASPRTHHNQAESARITKPESLASAEAKAQMLVRVGRSTLTTDRQSSTHPEMHDQYIRSVESNHQVLRSPTDLHNLTTHAAPFQRSPINALPEAGLVDSQVFDLAANQNRFQTPL
jgi:hypothetical protein